MKNKNDFSWYTQDDLLNVAYDIGLVASMESATKNALIRELALRLQRTTDELHRAAR